MPQPVIGIDFFVIGAMKAGTTAMCDWLDAQGGVAISSPKEPSIFVSDTSVMEWAPRIDELFDDRDLPSLRGEGSTDYTKFPALSGVPERVHRHSPQAKLVYLMRHPVERAISQYRFEWLLGAETMPFEQALDANPALIDNGRYAFQLRQWLEFFSPDRFLLVFSESFSREPEAQVRRVLDFLAMPDEQVQTPRSLRKNQTSLIVRRTLARKLLRDSRFGKAIRPYVPEAIAAGHRRMVQEKSKPVITDDIKTRIVDAFNEDLASLSAIASGPEITCETWDDVARTWTPQLHTP